MDRLWGVLGKPWMVALTVAAGMAIGLRFPNAALAVRPLGNIYMAFLSMCALPIIILSIMSSVGRAAHSGMPRRRLALIAAVFVAGGVMASCLGMGLMFFLGGDLSDELRGILGRTFISGERIDVAKAMTLWDILGSLVPDNLFSALSGGRFLACLFFSMLLGAALGVMRDEGSSRILNGLATLCGAFYQIMRWGLKLLAPGLFCMVAGQFATMRLEVLPALGRLVALFFAGCLVLCACYALALRRASGGTMRDVLAGMGQSAGVAFVAASSALAMPLAFEGLERNLGQRTAVVRIVLPLGVAINRQAYAMLFSMVAMFVLRLQGGETSPGVFAAICLCAILSGMPASGSPAAIAPLIAYVLAPVGLPVSLGMGVLVVVSPIIDSVCSMTNLCASCSASGIVDSLEARDSGGIAPAGD